MKQHLAISIADRLIHGVQEINIDACIRELVRTSDHIEIEKIAALIDHHSSGDPRNEILAKLRVSMERACKKEGIPKLTVKEVEGCLKVVRSTPKY